MSFESERSSSGAPVLIIAGVAVLGLVGWVFVSQQTDQRGAERDAPEVAVPTEEPTGTADAASAAELPEIQAGQASAAPQQTEAIPQTGSSGSVPPLALTGSSTVGSSEGTATPAVQRPKPVMPWESWPKPKMAFVLTGEQHGYFEPCGCTSNQLGGMSRRANLVQRIRDAGWPVRGLDVGGLSRRSVRQSQIKFETTLAALRQLNYIAVCVGPEELRLGPDFLLTQHIVDGDSPLFFVSANLEFFGIPDLGTPVAKAIADVEGAKIGITGIMGDSVQKTVLPHSDITWKPAEPELEKVLADFQQAEVQLPILLSQSSVEESRKLAEQFPQFPIVITAEGIGDPDPDEPPEKVGKSLLIGTGRKGKYVGVLGWYPDDAETPFRYQLVSLERDDFDETPAMIKLMAGYQERLKDEKIVLVDAISAPHPSTSNFVGAAACAECHTSAQKVWKDTAHAHALESLDPKNQRTGFERLNGVGRMYDPECLSCHVTGWEPQEYIRYRSGFLNEEFAAAPEEQKLHQLLAGSQCENCHGPGSRHIEMVNNGDDNSGESVRVTLEDAKRAACEKCHDADNSPKFDFDTFWDQIRHPGLD
ncbi:MAG: multiheme c-type cytochrome [Planctomycetaceae bacterium]